MAFEVDKRFTNGVSKGKDGGVNGKCTQMFLNPKMEIIRDPTKGKKLACIILLR